MNRKKLSSFLFSKKTVLILMISLIAGTLSVVISYHFTQSAAVLISGFLLAGGLAAGIAMILTLLSNHQQEVEQRIEAAEADIKSAIGIRPFTSYPLKLGNWNKGYAASAHFLEWVSREISFRKPALIVECGSGSSTILCASQLKKLGKGKIISLDHDSEYAAITRKQIEAENLTDRAEIVTAPIKVQSIDGDEHKWYDFNPDHHINQPIDMLVVDGPPGDILRLARYPAVPVLREFLSPECLIILDDGKRQPETETAKQWADLLDTQAEFINEGRGIWLIENNKKT